MILLKGHVSEVRYRKPFSSRRDHSLSSQARGRTIRTDWKFRMFGEWQRARTARIAEEKLQQRQWLTLPVTIPADSGRSRTARLLRWRRNVLYRVSFARRIARARTKRERDAGVPLAAGVTLHRAWRITTDFRWAPGGGRYSSLPRAAPPDVATAGRPMPSDDSRHPRASRHRRPAGGSPPRASIRGVRSVTDTRPVFSKKLARLHFVSINKGTNDFKHASVRQLKSQ